MDHASMARTFGAGCGFIRPAAIRRPSSDADCFQVVCSIRQRFAMIIKKSTDWSVWIESVRGG